MDFPEGVFAGVTALMLTHLYSLTGIVFLLGSVLVLLVRWQYFQFTKAWFVTLIMLFAPVSLFILSYTLDPMDNSAFWEWMDLIYLYYPLPAILIYAWVIKKKS